MWERESNAWMLHFRAGTDLEVRTYKAGPFRVDVAWDTAGTPYWVKVFDYPESNAAERAGLDPGWAGNESCVEFRLRQRSVDLPDHVEIVPAPAPVIDGALLLGWQEDPFPRIGAVALVGSLVDLNALPGELPPPEAG